MTTADLKSIVKAAQALRRQDEERPVLLATVVNVAGSSDQRMGGRMLIAEDRWVTGTGSGQCPKGDLIRKAWWLTRDGAPALLSHVAKGDEIDRGLGVGSSGPVDVLLEPCDIDDPYDPVAFLETCLVAEKPGAVAIVVRSNNRRVAVGSRLQIGPDDVVRSQIADEGLSRALATQARAVLDSGQSEIYAEGGFEALVEAVVPSPDIYLFDIGSDAEIEGLRAAG
jgi:xanthine dehydrogenase accessory factor